ncbi:bifunctional DNA-formamidopyrimidine glycosylase/DNA-(apurinic or apyrimidinic site) lyase [Herbiconiux sp. L3-i23]|uniref:bifunctional DNA-formamidopyrimidine glycosylase/DNA-(apurinic or apyrimidinic site) lyase n=1 Tax=Herbiconiux sp. L3-i23 TaxID=2905871 RepID=UPI00205D5723|nr:bifunctional DNA-formamidopyrimidine glycosylase/DNA-(apurinic or apyrimidinic site) lyase [Herbiconiux sp. L3-i23]BDI21877.1 formamidopyrimidine-DNA glycosylase [Herbiconiux sp. L3-i23]
MPELPEVETVRAGLAPVVSGASVTGVRVLDGRSLRRHLGPVESFADELVGATFAGAVRRGKFLWLPIEGVDRALVAHLGMSGQVLLRTSDAEDDRLLRIRIEIDSPEHGPLSLAFVDQRIFGSMAIDDLLPGDGRAAGFGSDDPRVPGQVAHIARDPLDPAFDERAFFAALRRRNTGIKRALLDQTLVSGVGNIYADEALWAAKLHFETPTSTLSRPKATTLLAELRSVLARALEDGGTSFDAQYVNVNGASGYFSQRLNAYGQQGKPCARCGRPIARTAFMNRSSHYCPHCQRLPRLKTP